MTRILASSVDRKNKLQKSIARATSVIYEELDKATSKTVAYKELADTVDHLNLCTRSMKHVPAISSMKKGNVIRQLIDARKEHFRADPGARDAIEDQVRKAFDEKYPPFMNEELMQDICGESIFCLNDEVLQLERYRSNKK